MRIRAIRLDNVRRFTEPVSVGPVGDGVTLLCEPNEAGKSTLFDALHALFFVRHVSFAAEVKALQPHSGGKIAVECDIEEDGKTWRIRKQWQSSSGGEAKIWRDGVLVHQGDAAEDWLATRVVGERGGPGGLLWVRQGRTTWAADRKEAGTELERRRDLLTAVSGALDEVTGGERMDRALDRVTEELGRLETATGRSKAGGALFAAETELSEAEARDGTLRAQVHAFRDELAELRRVEADLASAEDPEAAAERARSIATVSAELEAAERHADKVEAAGGRARLARQDWRAAVEAAKRGDAARAALARAEATEKAASEEEERRAAARDTAEAASEAADAALGDARERARGASEMLRQVRRRADALAARARREELSTRLDRAERAEAARIDAAARAASGPDPRALTRAEAGLRDRDARRALREAAAPSVTFHAAPGAGGATLDGAPLDPERAHPVPSGAEIGLPGLGRLRIDVPRTGDEGLARAEAALRAALGGWPDIDAMRAAAAARDAAAAEAQAQALARDALAPDGIAALREARAQIPDAPADEDDVPDPAEAEAALTRAEDTLKAAETREAEARARREAARVAAATAKAELRAARDGLTTARTAVDALPEEIADLDALRAAAETAEAEHETLVRKAPPKDALRGKLDRLRGVQEGERRRAAALRERRAELRVRVEAGGEEGVEEMLAEAEARLARARERLDVVGFERDVLRRLRDALEAARADARDAYFDPVARELRPLLGGLWDDAELNWSDDTLLPDTLVRRGTPEPIDVLSGGTQEQIAFLVRLAFARLLARSGRHAPLILDDALVYSDDDRIEKMFDALHGAAGDLQIIVLSCRQKVFRELGAPRLSFRPMAQDD